AASSVIRVAVESSEPQAPDGERKTVTALFADIKGSTELMEDLDPEEARAIIDPALQLMIEAVRRYDGYVVQCNVVAVRIIRKRSMRSMSHHLDRSPPDRRQKL